MKHLPTFAELYIKQSLHVANAETFKPALNLGHLPKCARERFIERDLEHSFIRFL